MLLENIKYVAEGGSCQTVTGSNGNNDCRKQRQMGTTEIPKCKIVPNP